MPHWHVLHAWIERSAFAIWHTMLCQQKRSCFCCISAVPLCVYMHACVWACTLHVSKITDERSTSRMKFLVQTCLQLVSEVAFPAGVSSDRSRLFPNALGARSIRWVIESKQIPFEKRGQLLPSVKIESISNRQGCRPKHVISNMFKRLWTLAFQACPGLEE